MNDMKRLKHNTMLYKGRTLGIGLLWSLLFMALGCSDFVTVDPPKNIMVSETVFEDPATVEAALANLYYAMREEGMVSGNQGLTTRLAIYSDELDYFGNDLDLLGFYQNTVLPDNGEVLAWWSQAYGVIYGANDIILGVEASTGLDQGEKDRFMGQALFVRGFMHSLLVSLFRDVPYVTTTDYTVNNEVPRMPESEVYGRIINDLLMAESLLENSEVENGERTFVDRYVVKALLSRMYRHTAEWDGAATLATELISSFGLEDDLEGVFLKASTETIWQLKPGEEPRNTQEANQLIIFTVPGQTYAMSEGLLSTFEDGDGRRETWVESISDAENTLTFHYPYKYRASFSETESLEYSIQFRLAEFYLIRAEARARLGDIPGAQQDLNAIRDRAGLADTMASTESELLGAILRERRVELFAEQGHRWFDLVLMDRVDEVLGVIKPNWQTTDMLLPIPESELEANPNLLPQNPGY
tara:strand:+ start:44319 stop:45734 length:1416 start_codon:yes stop_codon:yes gene_type:complete